MIRLSLLFALLCAVASAAPNISPLGDVPDWSSLEKYQETMTRAEFENALEQVYCTRGVSADLIAIEEEDARFLIDREKGEWFTLRFAPNESSRKTPAAFWHSANSLKGLKIALDPGHLGGRWAQMEERWFQVGDSQPVQEGDMTLLVAKLIAPKLRALGAKVSFVRETTEPVTPKRPDDLKEIAREVLRRAGNSDPRPDYDGPADPEKEHTVRWESELLFYRNSEIRQRAKLVNAQLKPDVVLCLHFDAEAWNDPRHPTLIDHNHLHLLVNGSYLPGELEFNDVRFEMLRRLLSRAHEVEFPLAEKAAVALARRTLLLPYEYTTDNVTRIGSSGYVYARNLMATRLYQPPVIYYEPYVMNSDEVFWRVQAGDYEGVRSVNGTDRPSIFREYADGVVDGLLDYYRASR